MYRKDQAAGKEPIPVFHKRSLVVVIENKYTFFLIGNDSHSADSLIFKAGVQNPAGMLLKIRYTFCLLLLMLHVGAQPLRPLPAVQEVWSKPFPPFRIVGNLYYVGMYDLAAYLIVTPQGNILINTGLAESGPVIEKNIETLGFKVRDTRILLTTQAHYDHVAAMAYMKTVTGALMMTMEGDVQVMKDGGNSDYVFGGKGSTFTSVETDRVLRDNDKIRLGGTVVTVHNSAGHTKGSASYTLPVTDGGKTYRVLIANMPTILEEVKLSGMPSYPNVGKDFANTFASLRKIPFDIFLASHASQFDLHEKYKAGDRYNPMRFVDHGGFLKSLDELEKVYRERLAKEK